MMRPNSRVTLILATLFTLTGVGHASANPSGVSRDLWMSAIYVSVLYLDANVSYTVETSNLQPLVAGGTADTVIHIQNQDADGSFVAGNDDSVGLASSVTFSVPTSRSVYVIVRAFNDSRPGTATLTVKRAGVTQWSTTITFAGRVLDLSGAGLAATSHVFTVEQFNGPNDAVLLTVSGSAANGIAFDDDDGVGNQSWLHLNGACAVGNCLIVYGRYNSGTEGYGTVMWDGDIHVTDADADGLGVTLEQALTTTDSDPDFDDDGLGDAAEVVGVEASPPVKLATWGANPKVKDVFVEVDWNACPNAQCPGDPAGWKFPTNQAQSVVALMAPDINVHLDIGRTNTATTLAEWSKWGDWGGAAQATGGYCVDLTPSRNAVRLSVKWPLSREIAHLYLNGTRVAT